LIAVLPSIAVMGLSADQDFPCGGT